ncbi:hypothetical protein I9W82_005113 [Candida metapsilosis]|uniref:Uncharacterized protein n=1 Tax=Candida metapsilosis TaxID=273372 RepID=A0A8H7Z904_9ASCO|nr:hypothetical protein I9W82_005113 [Candida metapsilosis]
MSRSNSGAGATSIPQMSHDRPTSAKLETSSFVPSGSQSPSKFNVPLPAHELSQTTARLASPRSSPRKLQQDRSVFSADPFQALPNLAYPTDSHSIKEDTRNDVESPYNVNYQGPITLEYLRYICRMLRSQGPTTSSTYVMSDPFSSSSESENRMSTSTLQDNRSDTMGTSPFKDIEHNAPASRGSHQSPIEEESLIKQNKPEKKPVSYLQKILLAQTAKAEELKSAKSETPSDNRKITPQSEVVVESLPQPDNSRPSRKKRKIIGAKPDFTIEVQRREQSASPNKVRTEEPRATTEARMDFFNKHGASILKSPDLGVQPKNAGSMAQAPSLFEGESVEKNSGPLESDRDAVSVAKLTPDIGELPSTKADEQESRESDQIEAQPEEAAERHHHQEVFKVADHDEGAIEVIPDGKKSSNENDEEVSKSNENNNEGAGEDQSLVRGDNALADEEEQRKKSEIKNLLNDENVEETGRTEAVSHDQGDVSKQEEGTNMTLNVDTIDDDDEVILVGENDDADSEEEKRTEELSKQVPTPSEVRSDPAHHMPVSDHLIAKETQVEIKDGDKLEAEKMFSVFHDTSNTGKVEIDTFQEVDLSSEESDQSVEGSSSESKDEEPSLNDIELFTKNLLHRQSSIGGSAENNQIYKLPNSILQLLQSQSDEFLQNVMDSLKLYALSRDSNKVDMTDLILYLRSINFGNTGETMGDIERVFDIAQDHLPLELIIELENSIEKALSELEAGDEGGLFLNDEGVGDEVGIQDEAEEDSAGYVKEDNATGDTREEEKGFSEDNDKEDSHSKNKDNGDDVV